MAKNKNKKRDIILTQGLLIGDDATRLINISEKNDIVRLDFTLFCPELETEPDKILNDDFLKRLHTQPHKTEQLYHEAISDMYGNNLRDIGFKTDRPTSGLSFSFQAHADWAGERHPLDAPPVPQLVTVVPVLAIAEKRISFDMANDTLADYRDPRLDMMQAFMRGHDIIAGKKTAFGEIFNAQTMMTGIGNMAYALSRKMVFDYKLETIHRIKSGKDNREKYHQRTDFINTGMALSRRLDKACQTFFDVNVHDSAFLNLTALHKKHERNAPTFTAKNTRALALVYSQQGRKHYTPYHKRYGV